MTLSAKLSLVSTLGGVALRSGVERLHPPARPTDLATIPRSAEDLTPAWLTAALCGAQPGAEVVDVQLGSGTSGTTTRRAITVAYNEVGEKAEMPTQFYTKSTPQFTSRLLAGYARVLDSECTYYNDVRPRLDIESPRATSRCSTGARSAR